MFQVFIFYFDGLDGLLCLISGLGHNGSNRLTLKVHLVEEIHHTFQVAMAYTADSFNSLERHSSKWYLQLNHVNIHLGQWDLHLRYSSRSCTLLATSHSKLH